MPPVAGVARLVEDPEIAYLVRDVHHIGGTVVTLDADQDQEPGTDVAERPRHDRSHAFSSSSPPRRTRRTRGLGRMEDLSAVSSESSTVESFAAAMGAC